MNRFVVDACVAVKWLVSEDYSAIAFGLTEPGNTIIVPDLFFSEIANTLWMKHRRGQMDAENARKALRGLFGVGLEIPRDSGLRC
jgi:predicted nucleic acid-binding protein